MEFWKFYLLVFFLYLSLDEIQGQSELSKGAFYTLGEMEDCSNQGHRIKQIFRKRKLETLSDATTVLTVIMTFSLRSHYVK